MNHLRKHRVAAGFTKKDAAAEVGVTQPTYEKWESGNKNVPKGKLALLSEIFSVSADALLGVHAPISATPYSPASPDEVLLYGQIAFLTSGGHIAPVSCDVRMS